MKQCTNCDFQVENHAEFCPNCGTALLPVKMKITAGKTTSGSQHDVTNRPAHTSTASYSYNRRNTFSMAWYHLQIRVLFWISIGCRCFSSLGAIVGDGLSIASGYLYVASLVLSFIIRSKLMNKERKGIYLYWGNLILMMIADVLFYTYVWEDDISAMLVMLALDAAFLLFNVFYYRKRRFLFN